MIANKNLAKFFIFLSFFAIFLFPIISLADDPADNGGLVPCGVGRSEVVITKDPATGKDIETGGEILNPCETNGFVYLMKMINTVINFVLFKMALPIAAIMFAYAGFLLVTSGGETSKRSKAKSIFVNVAIGLVIAVAAWLIINTILSIVGFHGEWVGFTG
jgi:hypothetical protein